MKNQRFNKVVGVIIVLAVIMVAVFGACQAAPDPSPTPKPSPSPKPSPTPTESTIDIGGILMLTGPLAMWGVPLQNLYEMQVEEINAAGGIKVGDDVFKLNLILEDDAYTSEKAIGALNKLLYDDNVKLLFTSMVGGINENTQENLEKANAVGFDQSAASVLTPNLTRIWRLAEADTFRTPAQMAALSKDFPDAKSVASICSTNALGIQAQEAFAAAVPKYSSWELVDEVAVPDGTKDFTPSVAKILMKNPDIIYVAAFGPGDVALFIKQARETGFDGPIMWNSDVDPSVINPIAGEQNNTNVYIPHNDAELTPELVSLMDSYEAKFGERSSLASYGSDFIPVIVQAIQQAGGNDPAKIMAALETGTFSSILGPAQFTGQATFGFNHQFLRPIGVAKFVEGKMVQATTLSAAELMDILGEN